MPEAEREVAERAVMVPRLEAEPGPFALGALVAEPLLGVLILRGFVAVSVAIGDRAVEQILGPGDVIHPIGASEDTVPARFGHRVVERALLAVLERRFIAATRHWPGLLLTLHERLRTQQRQLFIHAAASKQRRAEDRVLAALWQLADQWGSVTLDGIVLPLALSHATLGRLSGASRPTISLALAALAEGGHLHRNAAGRMVLAPESWRLLDPGSAAALPAPPRRRAAVATPAAPRTIDRAALQERLAALHAGFEDRVRDVDALLAAARETSARSAETRRRLRETREGASPRPPAPDAA